MCTAVSFKTNNHYFGRNLDIEYSYNETITIMPRNYKIKYVYKGEIKSRYAIIGMAYVNEGYPLFYDGANEMGLCVAALSFGSFSKYFEEKGHHTNIASFEFIPWLLSNCATVCEAQKQLQQMNITNDNYSNELKTTPLHWIIADGDNCIVAESTKDGLKVYDNPVGVLTNSPEFPYHLFTLNNYMGLSNKQVINKFSSDLPLEAYSRGMGAMGLPGDLSSNSRFVKAVFTKMNCIPGNTESENISQFYHILTSVEQQKGCVVVDDKYEYTTYSSCINATKGIYYYTTYQNRSITAVDMHRENLDGEKLVMYPLIKEQQILKQN